MALGLHVLLVSGAGVSGRAAHQKDMKAKRHADETQSPRRDAKHRDQAP
jgi:hypothetical protein